MWALPFWFIFFMTAYAVMAWVFGDGVAKGALIAMAIPVFWFSLVLEDE